MELFCCPVCGAALQRQAGALRCPAHHSFDVAREGYAHLLPASRMHAKVPGDSREMVAARRALLDSGLYSPFAEALGPLVCAQARAGHIALLDAGCGEGYYTAHAARALRAAGIGAEIAAYDISKFAVRAATKRDGAIQWAVAGSFCIPVPDARFDCVLNIFSPMVAAEFARVLRPGGALIYAVPGARHLYGLKQILYEHPYENAVQDISYDGFALERRVPVCTQARVTGRQILDLFAMTPYYWKTPREGAERLAACEALETELAFDFLIYRRV